MQSPCWHFGPPGASAAGCSLQNIKVAHKQWERGPRTCDTTPVTLGALRGGDGSEEGEGEASSGHRGTTLNTAHTQESPLQYVPAIPCPQHEDTSAQQGGGGAGASARLLMGVVVSDDVRSGCVVSSGPGAASAAHTVSYCPMFSGLAPVAFDPPETPERRKTVFGPDLTNWWLCMGNSPPKARDTAPREPPLEPHPSVDERSHCSLNSECTRGQEGETETEPCAKGANGSERIDYVGVKANVSVPPCEPVETPDPQSSQTCATPTATDATSSSECVVAETQRRKCHILRMENGQMIASADPAILPRSQVENQPCVVSLIGGTQLGKSFLLGNILNKLEWKRQDLLPVVGDEVSSKTTGIDFFSCGEMIFLDYEGSNGGVPETDRNLVWNIFPRIAYAVSSTLVYVTRNPPATVTIVGSIVSALKEAALSESKETYAKPHLIIVFNQSNVEEFTLEGLKQKDPDNVPVLEELFSSVKLHCVPPSCSPKFPGKIEALLELFRGKRIQLPASQWMLLFDYVVTHFTVPECPPIPLCKVYSTLLNHLPEPLDRLQQLFLTYIPNRYCKKARYRDSCEKAKRAFAFVLAVYWHTKPRHEDEIEISGRFHQFLSFLAQFAPCVAECKAKDGTKPKKCLIQHFCHSSVEPTHSYAPGDFDVYSLDNGYLEDTKAQITRALEALNDPVFSKYNLKSDCFEGEAPLNFCGDLISEFNQIHRDASMDSSTRLANGASLGALLAVPPAILVSSTVIGAPLGIIFLCAGAAVGGTMGMAIGPLTSPQVIQRQVMALMEDAALRAYASGRIDAVVIVVDWLTIKIAPAHLTIKKPQVLAPTKSD
ncbi:hypothetical protein Pelo_471 [Pelomyxa schiedti]|nr:hypothetical protein Pelo_471 [Pelomyxa schiedti]